MRITGLLGSVWTIKVLAWSTLVVLVVYKRYRHLIVAVISVQATSLVAIALSAAVRRPRPFGVEIEGVWAGWSMPSRPVTYLSAISVAMLYSLVPKGRWRQLGKWVATALVALLAFARMYLGVDTPVDVLVGAAIRGPIPCSPSAGSPPTTSSRSATPGPHRPPGRRRGPRRGHPARPLRPARPGDRGGEAVRAGRLGRVHPAADQGQGDPDTWLFGKLCAPSTCGRTAGTSWAGEAMYGRLEDEKPFHTVRRLVQQEDYALHKLHLAGLPNATYGFVGSPPTASTGHRVLRRRHRAGRGRGRHPGDRRRPRHHPQAVGGRAGPP